MYTKYIYIYIALQSPSCVWLSATRWTAAHQASLSLTISWSLPKFMSISLLMPSSHLILWCPHLLPSIFPASVTFPVSQLIASDDSKKYWSLFQHLSVPPTSIQGWFPLRFTGLISLLSKGLSGVFSSTAVQRYQLFHAPCPLWSSSHNHTWSLGRPWLYDLCQQSYVSAFLTLSRFVIAFLPRRNTIWLWLQSPSAVILEPKKRKSVTASTFAPSICHEALGPDVMILIFFF